MQYQFLTILILFLTVFSCNDGKRKEFDCESIIPFKEIEKDATDFEIIEGEIDSELIPIDSSFFEKYLSNLEEFSFWPEYSKIYFHSVPKLVSENCQVILKSVIDFNGTNYYMHLVEIENGETKVLELACYEHYPDGSRNRRSFINKNDNLIITDILSGLEEYNSKEGFYVNAIDSISMKYTFLNGSFDLVDNDSIRFYEKYNFPNQSKTH